MKNAANYSVASQRKRELHEHRAMRSAATHVTFTLKTTTPYEQDLTKPPRFVRSWS